MLNILITNDDGISAPALNVLKKKLSKLGNVTIIAPEVPMNAMGNSLTLHKPIRIMKVKKDKYYVNGTPADCVRLGILSILDDNVDIVVSGINVGGNLGDDVNYSGTVAGAREAALLGVPSLASSLVINKKKNYIQAAEITFKVAKKILDDGIPPRTFFNLNVPDVNDGGVKGIKITRMGIRIYERSVCRRNDPLGREYFWLVGEKLDGIADCGTDFEAIKQGYASLTPLIMDYTDYKFKEKLKNWDLP